MAVVKTVLKNVNQETVVKVAGTAAAATIDLSTDIVAASQEIDGSTQTVNIIGLVWTGATDGSRTGSWSLAKRKFVSTGYGFPDCRCILQRRN